MPDLTRFSDGCPNRSIGGCGEYPLRALDPKYRMQKAMERMHFPSCPGERHFSTVMRKLLRSACGRECLTQPVGFVLRRVLAEPCTDSSVPATLVLYRRAEEGIQYRILKLFCDPSLGGPGKGPLYSEHPESVPSLKASAFENGILCPGDFSGPIREVFRSRPEFRAL